ncbi:6-phosphogluconate dehydrogenase [Arthroderma uncinatum]|uniref:6-phosphogluconate dehydrogenase n=1 Tax=Arthroderma uncinatum TaxID=74035 RepID=UPI00144AD09E|nr:6-phosphogluconate dehydrogenase [Arthroderma uncinatum]KAF3482716.1 6-phosphogluconate dehydrogenase [Arthroderma uncinatum]
MAPPKQIFKCIGIAGAGNMGATMAFGFAEKGIKVSLWDAKAENVDNVMSKVEGEKGVQENIRPFNDIHEFVKSVDVAIDSDGRGRRPFIFSITHGWPVDSVLGLMMDDLEDGDIILDGGNENYRNTERRQEELEKEGVSWIGMGVSGGNHSTRKGPSLALGGDAQAIRVVMPLLKEFAAQDPRTGESCVANIGTRGAGHYVKMVHNAIENGMLSSICEAWALLHYGLGKSYDEIGEIFESWDSEGPLRNTFLVQIGSSICREKKKKKQSGERKSEKVDETYILDEMHDAVGDGDDDTAGTLYWSVMEAADRHVSAPSIAAGQFLRVSSRNRKQRLRVAQKLSIEPPKKLKHIHDVPTFVEQLRDATYISILSSFCQGLELIARGSKDEKWNINLGDCLKIWRAGSIIQEEYISDLLMPALTSGAHIMNMKLIDEVAAAMKKNFDSLKQVVLKGTESDAYIPSLSASLEYLKYEGARMLPTQFMEAELAFLNAHRYDWPGVRG